jgi:hypothetical protein
MISERLQAGEVHEVSMGGGKSGFWKSFCREEEEIGRKEDQVEGKGRGRREEGERKERKKG